MPLLLVTYLFSRRHSTAVYAKEAFQPAISDLVMDLLLQDPEHIALRSVPTDAANAAALKQFAAVAGEFVEVTPDAIRMGKAKPPPKPSLIFEMQMGMVDRGADLSWLSQYPFEKEILFAPLTALQVVDTRIEGRVQVVIMRATVNQGGVTIDTTGARTQRATPCKARPWKPCSKDSGQS